MAQGFISHKNGFSPGQTKTVKTNLDINALADLIKQDARLALKNIAHSVGILSGRLFRFRLSS